MTTVKMPSDDLRVVPEWELQDRLARSLRLVGGLTQADVAHFMGVRRETVGRWMNGQTKPSFAVLRIWSDMTGCDLQWLETGQAPSGDPTGPAVYAIRDSNPEPADSEFDRSNVKRLLTLIVSHPAA